MDSFVRRMLGDEMQKTAVAPWLLPAAMAALGLGSGVGLTKLFSGGGGDPLEEMMKLYQMRIMANMMGDQFGGSGSTTTQPYTQSYTRPYGRPTYQASPYRNPNRRRPSAARSLRNAFSRRFS